MRSHASRSARIASLVLESGDDLSLGVEFRDTGSPESTPVALGFRGDVDAISVEVDLPNLLEPGGILEEHLPSARRAFFAHLISTASELDGIANTFQRGWLVEIYLSALTERALDNHESVQFAHNGIMAAGLGRTMESVLETIFQSLPDVEDQDRPVRRQRLHEQIDALFSSNEVRDAIDRCAMVLWEAPGAHWKAWAEERFRATLAGAIVEACQRLCPEFDVEGLLVDLDPGPRTGGDRIWISEPDVGGGGVVEEIARRFAEDPWRFFRLIEGALAPSDFEVIDGELTRVLDLEEEDEEISDAIHRVRTAESNDERAGSFDDLIQRLDDQDVFVSHPVGAALAARILRPGATNESDALLRGLLRQWHESQERLGLEVDTRVVAYLGSADNDIDYAIGIHPRGTDAQQRQWRFNALAGLLWPRGLEVRAASLHSSNRFVELPPTDRSWVASALADPEGRIEFGSEHWKDRVQATLGRDGNVILWADRSQRRRLATAIGTLLSDPVEVQHLHLYPRVAGARRARGSFEILIDLRDAIA